MKYAIATTIIGGALLLWLLLSGSAGASPQAAYAGSVETTPCPAPQRIVRMAIAQYRAARHAHARWVRAKRCLGETARLRVAARPSRDRSAAVWLGRMEVWGQQSGDFKRRLAKLIRRMKDPGGPAVASKWWPAALWCGWDPSLKSWFCYVVQRESTARPLAVNPSSGCFGLLQLHPMHWRHKGLAWIRDVFNQLRLGWKLYREAGAQPWAL